jgi:hypothetical protein
LRSCRMASLKSENIGLSPSLSASRQGGIRVPDLRRSRILVLLC